MLSALKGDAKAYEIFLEKTATVVSSFLCRASFSRISSSELIDDVVQEVLVSIHRKRHLYCDHLPILPWIRAIAKHRFIDHLRKEKDYLRQDEWIEGSQGNGDRIAFANFSQDQSHDVPERDAILANLSDQQKEIFCLAKIEEIPLAEIAKIRGMTLSAVKTTIHRSVKLIRMNFKKNSEKSL